MDAAWWIALPALVFSIVLGRMLRAGRARSAERADAAPVDLPPPGPDGWSPLREMESLRSAIRKPPRSGAIRDQLLTDLRTPISALMYAAVVSLLASGLLLRNVTALMAAIFMIGVFGRSFARMVRLRRHGIAVATTTRELGEQTFDDTGLALVAIPDSLACANSPSNVARVIVPWRACRSAIERDGAIDLLVVFDPKDPAANAVAVAARSRSSGRHVSGGAASV